MSTKTDSNMRAKILKVRKYDMQARRERLAMDTIQDSRQRIRNSKSVPRYELVYESGRVERFKSYESMQARYESREKSVVYVRDLFPGVYSVKRQEIELYIIKFKNGRFLRFYSKDNAVARLNDDDKAVQLMYFPSLEILTK